LGDATPTVCAHVTKEGLSNLLPGGVVLVQLIEIMFQVCPAEQLQAMLLIFPKGQVIQAPVRSLNIEVEFKQIQL
jgi:hypothetical protein